ncbi:MAG TPA: sugar transferase [Candidatus Elarobacter sp.]|jgi:lipopolysaccharide/colanic/teichoic acid biosynthesis glycosyltransferase
MNALLHTTVEPSPSTRQVRTDAPLKLPIDVVFVERRGYRALRRAVDIVVASLVCILSLPVLAVAALAIVIEDGGPVFFEQRRVGRFERLFTIYKLRTMRQAECADRLSPAGPSDARITAVGRWLRKLSIDELPQLWNVLRGDMTLVGPRPEMPFVVERYEPWQHLRHLAVPGITGLWQITCRSKVPLHRPEATLLDLHYIRTSSTLTDLSILAKTLQAVVFTEGAY